MKFQIAFCLILIQVAAGLWDCRNYNNNDCQQGTCSFEFGNCTCDQPTLGGYDCHVFKGFAVLNCADPECAANGEYCYDDPFIPGVETCVCYNGYYGPSCQYPTEAVVECDLDKMYINIRVEDWFVGDLLSNSTDPACNVEDITNFVAGGGPLSDPRLEGFGAEIMLNGCGVVVEADTPNAGDTTFTYDMIIDYDPLFIYNNGIDEKLLRFTCVQTTSAPTGFETVQVAELVDLGLTPEPVEAQGFFDLTTAVMYMEGRVPLSGPIALGQQLEYVITLTPGSSAGGIGIESCTFYDGNGGNARTYIVNQCIGSQLSFSVTVDPSWETISATEIQVNFNAFQYVGATTAEIACEVNFCGAPTDAECTYCAFAKKKRSLRERRDSPGLIHNETVRFQFTVLSPSQYEMYYVNNPRQEPHMTNTVSADESSASNISFLATTITLGALLLVAVIICVVMAMKLLSGSQSSAKTAYDNPVYPMKA